MICDLDMLDAGVPAWKELRLLDIGGLVGDIKLNVVKALLILSVKFKC